MLNTNDLRETAKGAWAYGYTGTAQDLERSADEIDRLRAEVKRTEKFDHYKQSVEWMVSKVPAAAQFMRQQNEIDRLRGLLADIKSENYRDFETWRDYVDQIHWIADGKPDLEEVSERGETGTES